MEVVQVQPRDFYLHYIYVPTKGTAIRWSFTTSKNNIAFGLYQRLGHTPLPSSSDIVLKAHQCREQLKPYALTKKTEDETSSVNSVATTHSRPRSKSVASEKLKEREDWVELVPIEYVNSVKTKVEGSYTVQESGNYILVFDNTFSKNTPKVVTFSVALIDPNMEHAIEQSSKAEMSGWLLKKRRKKLQGWAKRWFELSRGGVLSYSARPDSLSRGSIQLLLATISTNPEQHMIHIDSGSTLFHIKCPSDEEYEKWTKALRAHIDDESLYHNDDGSSLTSAINNGRRSSSQRAGRNEKIVASQERMQLASSNTSFTAAATETDYQNADRLWSQVNAGINNSELLHSFISTMSENNSEQNKIEALAAKQVQLWRDVQVSMQRLLNRSAPSMSNRSHSKQRSSTDLKIDNQYDDNGTSSKVPYKEDDSNSFASSEFFDAESAILSAYDEDFNQDTISSSSSSTSPTLSSSSDEEEEVDSILQGNKNVRQTRFFEVMKEPNNIHRRQFLPSSAINDGVSAISIFRKNIGKDLSQIAMPVSMNEPLSMLQRACEDLEYSDLLGKAAQCQDSMERLMYVATFAISTYAGSQWRSGKKPFNPMMSETYECIRPDKGFRFISEKVSHHPLIIATHSEAKDYQYWQCTKVKSKFWGKSMEFMTEGTFHITLKNYDSSNGKINEDDHYTFTKPSSWMRNMIAGEKYLEHVGEMKVQNRTTGEYGLITFKEGTGGGLFSAPKNRNNVVGVFYSFDGKKQKKIVGKWSESIAEDVNMNGRTLSVLWKAKPPANLENCKKYYGFSPFAIELNEITSIEKNKLPKTDTRFRPDLRLYEEGKVEAADEEKLRIEKMQRATRATFAEKGQSWNPRWFSLEEDPFEDPTFYSPDGQQSDVNKVGYSWKFNGDYWKVRETGNWPADMPDLW
ncbi:Oxysterol-binding protein-domain-containing protein [Mycotypha africana]|uniref:Oxysterol-binding protein-domain-containing protein n=1 Tax=Mycotypha africana TaxID=64632 RepID=UPI002300E34F|nr:Oxysterol-binding protein-domain-containing protein [Mycotypha africana]KAI8984223.1 Oxysterol-binding protein-domain-containing protein [Mycotypha africana]